MGLPAGGERMQATNDNRVTRIFPPLLLLASFVLSYQSPLAKMMERWQGGDNDYCFLVIPIFAYLLWEKRGVFRFSEFSWSWQGLVIALCSSLFVLTGEFGSLETVMYFGFWLAIAGVLLLLYGGRIRLLLFPLLVLIFVVPLPPYMNQLMTFQLKLHSSSLSVFLLRLLDISVMQEGNIIDLGVSKLQVVDACSGLRYFMPMLLMALMIGHLTAGRFWHRLVLLLLVVPLSVVINGLRIFVAGVLTVNGHEEMATNFFHDFSGWLGFMILAGLLAGTAGQLKKVDGKAPAGKAHDSGASSRGVMRSVLLSAMFCLVFSGTGWAVTRGEALFHVPERKTFADFPMRIGGLEGDRMYLDAAVLESLWADDYVQATFRDPRNRYSIHLLIPYYRYQGTMHTAHAPQSCLLGGGFDLLASDERLVDVEQGMQVPVMAMQMQKGDAKILAGYFFLQRGRVLTSPWLNKAFIVLDSFTKGRTDGALVRVEIQLHGSMSYDEAGREMDSFLRGLWPLLADYIPS
ncbi:MAG: VPLPA-CTERM-specific exosortase XrtD [Thermodesulfobacteriota bacterium]